MQTHMFIYIHTPLSVKEMTFTHFCIIDQIGKWSFVLRFVNWSQKTPQVGCVESRRPRVSQEVNDEGSTVVCTE